MLIKDGDCFRLYPWKVRYRQHGQEIEQWALPSKEWWTDFADRWEHTEILEFIEVELTEEQLARFEEIKDMPEDFMEMYIEYILTGNISNEVELPTNHPFQIIKLRKIDGQNTDYLVDIDFRLSMTELGL